VDFVQFCIKCLKIRFWGVEHSHHIKEVTSKFGDFTKETWAHPKASIGLQESYRTINLDFWEPN